MGKAGSNAIEATPEISPERHLSHADVDLEGAFTWDQRRHDTGDIDPIIRRRRPKRGASKLWITLFVRLPLKILLAVVIIAFVEQGLERYAPDPYGEWMQERREEAVSWVVETFGRETVINALDR